MPVIKLRVEISKDEEIRYISHLDYAGAIEKALKRAEIPVAYSEGFNPHMKLAFASALAVGLTSATEYMEVELKEQIDIKEFIAKFEKQLPRGIKVLQAKYLMKKEKFNELRKLYTHPLALLRHTQPSYWWEEIWKKQPSAHTAQLYKDQWFDWLSTVHIASEGINGMDQ